MVIPANLRVDRSQQAAEAVKTRREAQPISVTEAIVVERDRRQKERQQREAPHERRDPNEEFTDLQSDRELPPLEVYNQAAHEQVISGSQQGKLDVKA